MLRRSLQVFSICPAWWLFGFIFFSSSALAATVPPPASNVPFIMNLLQFMSKKDWMHVEDIQKNCPQLWSLNETMYKNDRLKGVLGSLDDMKNYCQPNQTLPPSRACQGAIGISEYVCQAMSNLEQPLYPLDKAISEKLASKGGLCEILSDGKFLETICSSMLKAATPSFQYDCNKTSSESFQDRCTDLCSGEGNNRACEIILQSLRTIIYWEQQKEKAAASPKEDGSESNIPSSSSSQNNSVPPAAVSKPDQTTSTASSPNNTSPSDNTTKVINSSSNSSVSSPKTTSSNTLTSPSSTTSVTSVKPSDTTSLPVASEDQAGSKDEPKLFDNNPDDLEPEEEAYPLEKPEKNSPSPDEDPAFEEDNADKNMEDSVIAPVKPGSPITYDTRIPDVDDGPVNTHFLFYFLAFVVLSVTSYIVYQRRNRIIALVVEGRSGPSSSGRRRSSSMRGERPSSGSYRKLVNNLEEAITSHSVKNSNVIY